MESIDWGTAPEGATHYNAECACPWLKEDPPSYFHNGDWIKYTRKDYENHFCCAAKRPQEWDGSGVPPVGTVCEYRLNEYDVWFTCKITYVLLGQKDSFVAWCDHLGSDQFLTFSSDRYKLQLRKIKTPEHTAEEERLHAIDDMNDLILGWGAEKRMLAVLYDAGYRKTDASK